MNDEDFAAIQKRLDETVLERVPHFRDEALAELLLKGYTLIGVPVHPDDASLWKRGCIRKKVEEENHAKG